MTTLQRNVLIEKYSANIDIIILSIPYYDLDRIVTRVHKISKHDNNIMCIELEYLELGTQINISIYLPSYEKDLEQLYNNEIESASIYACDLIYLDVLNNVSITLELL